MPDFSLCRNEECPLKYKCYRYTAVPNPLWQSITKYEFMLKTGSNEVYCEHFKLIPEKK